MFKQKNTDLYNFRCPFCNDSQKNKTKARGYIYRKANDYFMRCHNCGKSTTFSKFLQEIDAQTHRAYVLERYSSGETKNHNYQKPNFDDLKGNAFSKFEEISTTSKKWNQLQLENISVLPDGHYAKDYIEKRQIPSKFWTEIFFAPKFKDFLDSEFPNHGKKDVPNDDRIVLCYTNEQGEITNVAGRALSDTKIRYITVKIKDERKMFGLHRLRKDEKIYVVEGQFDSLFLPNSVASGDSNLVGVAEYLTGLDTVLVYDTQPRNKDLVKQIERAIDKNYTVCLLPDSLPGKDINEMMLNGMKIEELINLITIYTYSGITAKLEFIRWKKC